MLVPPLLPTGELQTLCEGQTHACCCCCCTSPLLLLLQLLADQQLWPLLPRAPLKTLQSSTGTRVSLTTFPITDFRRSQVPAIAAMLLCCLFVACRWVSW